MLKTRNEHTFYADNIDPIRQTFDRTMGQDGTCPVRNYGGASRKPIEKKKPRTALKNRTVRY